MTSGGTGSPHEPDQLSDEQRSAIFAAANAPRDHRGNVRAPRAPIPKKFVLWAVVAIVFLGVGGQIAGHFFQSYGKAPKATTTTSPSLTVTPTTLVPGTSLNALEAYIGVKFIASAKAHSFTLTTQNDKKWTLSSQRGKVVVLAFYDSICNDICPVLGTELREAAHELSAGNKSVEFAIVNTDPQQRSITPTTQALSVPGLSSTPSVVFLTGSVANLDAVWRAYGIRIVVGAKQGQVSHNNALYFVGPNGDLIAYANPFASESKSGVYSLSASVMHRFAQGVAATASSLVK
ncbi:MAG TPA: SCO family protein [Acidimicrobiales bacterium]|jgi:cytochrome oxidase Cu insertion factor (SCO1/SenC/PrrC family)|nr:SCO family protein [Acidimicrobiales bacterium]